MGFLGTGRFGSGILVSRLPDGSWSAPSTVALGGLGIGGLIGFELTDFVFVMSTDEAVARVMHSPSASLSLNVSAACGIGRSGEWGAMVGMRGTSGFYSFSKTRGIYGGVSGEVTLMFENSYANQTVYERKLKAQQLVGGEVPYPREAELLMRILNSDALRLEDTDKRSTVVDVFAQGTLPPRDLEAGLGTPEVEGDSEAPREIEGDSQAPREIEGDSQAPREFEGDIEHRRELNGDHQGPSELPVESEGPRELSGESSPSKVFELGCSQTPITPTNGHNSGTEPTDAVTRRST